MRHLLLVFCLFISIHASQAVELFVAPNGDDVNAGLINKPFQTIERAQQAARDIKIKQPVTIYLRGGYYFLTDPIVFNQANGGFENPLTISGYQDETAVVSGGVPMELDWSIHQGKILKAQVEPNASAIDELYVNDVRYRMARYPNFDPQAKFFGGTSGEAISPERVKTWKNPVGGYMHGLHSAMWGSKHYRIEGVNPDGSLKFQGGWQENRGGGFDPYFRGGFHKDYLFVENIFEELDAPGEWYLDRDNNVLYVYPLAGDDLAQASVIGASLDQLFIVKGSQDKPVKNLHIKNLRFKHTARIFMAPYERLLRGDWSIARLAAVHFEATENCAVEDCYFEGLGGNGVLISKYNRDAVVEGCRFAGLGESCIALVGNIGAVRSPAVEYSRTLDQDKIDLTPGPKTSNYPAQCKVHNNLMHSFGYIGKQTAGVFISMSEEITVSHNTIYNCPRASICINDGCWGGHIIEHNDAFYTVRESGDHGPFNSWGRDRFWKTSYNGGRDYETFAKERAKLDNYKTTLIRNNRFAHDGGHSWGIDLDDGSSNYHVYNNLCLGMGVKLREGFFRRVENNIIINGFGGFHVWIPGCDDVIARNIFVSDEPYQFIRVNPEYAKEFDYNLFYDQGRTPVVTGLGDPMPLDKWQARGFDKHSLIADPQFVDPQRGDYRVKPQSAALKLGFKNFAMNQFGVVKPEFQTEVGKVSRKFAPAKTEPTQVGKRSAENSLWLGATVKNLIGEAEKSAAGIGQETGVLIMKAPQDSPARKAGFKVGDVIIKWDNYKVHSLDDLTSFSKTLTQKDVRITVFNAVEREIIIAKQ